MTILFYLLYIIFFPVEKKMYYFLLFLPRWEAFFIYLKNFFFDV